MVVAEVVGVKESSWLRSRLEWERPHKGTFCIVKALSVENASITIPKEFRRGWGQGVEMV